MESVIGSRSCAAAAGFSGRQASHLQPQPVSACSRPAKKCRQLSRKTEITCRASVEGQLVHSRFPGYFDDDEGSHSQQSRSIVTPDSNSWGLSVSQMKAMGITNESAVGRTALDPESLRAVNYYGGLKVEANTRQEVTMSAGTGAAPGQVPPDLPSLLLDARICFIGMPLVPAVTELVISELLWLNYVNVEKPVYLYVHSQGSQTPLGEKESQTFTEWERRVFHEEFPGLHGALSYRLYLPNAIAYDNEAYSILDTMKYIKPDIYTLVLGEAMGNAAMLVAAGKKGNRFALKHARMMTCPPRMNRSFGSTVNMMIKAEDLEYNTQRYVDYLSKYTGKPKDVVRKDVGRNRYFSAQQAIDYGLIDHIVSKRASSYMESKDYEGALQRSQAQGRNRGVPAGAAAEGGY